MQCVLGAHARPQSKFGRVDLADDVSELGSGSQSLGVAPVTVPPPDWGVRIANCIPASLRDRRVGIFMDRAAWDIEIRDPLVEESNEAPHQSTLGLALFTEEEQIMTCQDRDHKFGNDRLIVTDDAWKEFVTVLQSGEEVIAEFVLDGLRLPTTGTQLG